MYKLRMVAIHSFIVCIFIFAGMLFAIGDSHTGLFGSEAFAQGAPGAGGGGANGAGGGGASGVGCNPGQICNPLKTTTIEGFLLALIDILLIFAIPVIVFFIIYSGFLFVTARGNESQIEKARTSLTWAVIGGVVVVGARAIVAIVKNTVEAI